MLHATLAPAYPTHHWQGMSHIGHQSSVIRNVHQAATLMSAPHQVENNHQSSSNNNINNNLNSLVNSINNNQINPHQLAHQPAVSGSVDMLSHLTASQHYPHHHAIQPFMSMTSSPTTSTQLMPMTPTSSSPSTATSVINNAYHPSLQHPAHLGVHTGLTSDLGQHQLGLHGHQGLHPSSFLDQHTLAAPHPIHPGVSEGGIPSYSSSMFTGYTVHHQPGYPASAASLQRSSSRHNSQDNGCATSLRHASGGSQASSHKATPPPSPAAVKEDQRATNFFSSAVVAAGNGGKPPPPQKASEMAAGRACVQPGPNRIHQQQGGGGGSLLGVQGQQIQPQQPHAVSAFTPPNSQQQNAAYGQMASVTTKNPQGLASTSLGPATQLTGSYNGHHTSQQAVNVKQEPGSPHLSHPQPAFTVKQEPGSQLNSSQSPSSQDSNTPKSVASSALTPTPPPSSAACQQQPHKGLQQPQAARGGGYGPQVPLMDRKYPSPGSSIGGGGNSSAASPHSGAGNNPISPLTATSGGSAGSELTGDPGAAATKIRFQSGQQQQQTLSVQNLSPLGGGMADGSSTCNSALSSREGTPRPQPPTTPSLWSGGTPSSLAFTTVATATSVTVSSNSTAPNSQNNTYTDLSSAAPAPNVDISRVKIKEEVLTPSFYHNLTSPPASAFSTAAVGSNEYSRHPVVNINHRPSPVAVGTGGVGGVNPQSSRSIPMMFIDAVGGTHRSSPSSDAAGAYPASTGAFVGYSHPHHAAHHHHHAAAASMEGHQVAAPIPRSGPNMTGGGGVRERSGYHSSGGYSHPGRPPHDSGGSGSGGGMSSSQSNVKIGRRPAHLPKVLKFEDPTLPHGWQRKLKQRKHGKQAGRWDVYIYSPCGVKFASRKKLKNFFDKNNLNYDVEQFDFTPYGKHIEQAVASGNIGHHHGHHARHHSSASSDGGGGIRGGGGGGSSPSGSVHSPSTAGGYGSSTPTSTGHHQHQQQLQPTGSTTGGSTTSTAGGHHHSSSSSSSSSSNSSTSSNSSSVYQLPHTAYEFNPMMESPPNANARELPQNHILNLSSSQVTTATSMGAGGQQQQLGGAKGLLQQRQTLSSMSTSGFPSDIADILNESTTGGGGGTASGGGGDLIGSRRYRNDYPGGGGGAMDIGSAATSPPSSSSAAAQSHLHHGIMNRHHPLGGAANSNSAAAGPGHNSLHHPHAHHLLPQQQQQQHLIHHHHHHHQVGGSHGLSPTASSDLSGEVGGEAGDLEASNNQASDQAAASSEDDTRFMTRTIDILSDSNTDLMMEMDYNQFETFRA